MEYKNGPFLVGPGEIRISKSESQTSWTFSLNFYSVGYL